MKAKLIINDREIEVEISEEELKKFEAKTAHHTGYERVRQGDNYYVLRESHIICSETERDDICDGDRYETANYYSSLVVAENNLRADILMRRLRRFAVKHRKLDYDDNVWYEIYYVNGRFGTINFENTRYFGSIRFDSEETAQRAINKFHDELIWYFTEYKDCV